MGCNNFKAKGKRIKAKGKRIKDKGKRIKAKNGARLTAQGVG